MFIFSREKFHQLLLLFFILSFVGGSIFLDFKIFGIQFYAYRLVILIGLFYFLVTRQLVVYTSKYEKCVFWFFLIWLIYGSASLYWCPDRAQGLKEIVYIFIGFSSYLFLLSMRNQIPNFEERFAKFWIVVFFGVLVFSINEIFTKSHFQSSFTESIAKFGVAHKINSVPLFTFDNPNHYAVYLCVTIVFSLYLLYKSKQRLLSILAIVSTLVLLYYMESRFSYIFLFFVFASVLYFNRSSLQKWKYYPYLKWFGIGSCLVILGGVVFIIGRTNSGSKIKCVQETSYSILMDRDFFLKTDSLNSGHAQNDVCLFMDAGLEFRTEVQKETIRTRYVNLEKYTDKHTFFLKKNRPLAKMVFPLFVILVVLILIIVLHRRKKQWKMLVVFAGLTTLILVGIFPSHSFKRVNQKWSNYVVIESLDARKTQAVIERLMEDRSSIVRGSFQNETSEKYMKGEEVVLKLVNLPVSSSEKSGSNIVRKKLVLTGIDYLKQSRFFGVGAGGYIALSKKGKSHYDLETIDSPHNLMIEVLSQYGIGIALFFIGLLIYPFIYLIREFRMKKWSINHLILLLLLICMFLMSNSNSTSLPLPIIWINFTFIILFFSKLVSANEKENDSTN